MSGLVYWRCPECEWHVGLPKAYVSAGDPDHEWDLLPITAARCEAMVEAHEATHQ